MTAATETTETEPKTGTDDTGYLTEDVLRELGSCDSYTREFHNLFPTSTHPDGARVTGDVCAANAGRFDWSWAVEVMLTPEAQTAHRRASAHGAPRRRELTDRLDELERVFHARSRYLRDREATLRSDGVDQTDRTYPLVWDDADLIDGPAVPLRVEDPDPDAAEAAFAESTGTRREAERALERAYQDERQPLDDEFQSLGARTFGELFEDPANRSEKLTAARRAARRRIRERALASVRQLESDLAYARDEAARLRKHADSYLTQAPDLEAKLAAARLAAAPHVRAQAADDAADAAARLERHRAAADAETAQLVEAADAAAAQLAAVEAELAEAAPAESTGD